jgi:hypothetical protein
MEKQIMAYDYKGKLNQIKVQTKRAFDDTKEVGKRYAECEAKIKSLEELAELHMTNIKTLDLSPIVMMEAFAEGSLSEEDATKWLTDLNAERIYFDQVMEDIGDEKKRLAIIVEDFAALKQEIGALANCTTKLLLAQAKEKTEVLQ